MSDHLDYLLKQRLQGFEAEPAEGAWDKIRAGIDQQNPTGGWFWKPLGGGILILLMIGSAYFYLDQGQESITETQQSSSDVHGSGDGELLPGPDNITYADMGSIGGPVDESEKEEFTQPIANQATSYIKLSAPSHHTDHGQIQVIAGKDPVSGSTIAPQIQTAEVITPVSVDVPPGAINQEALITNFKEIDQALLRGTAPGNQDLAARETFQVKADFTSLDSKGLEEVSYVFLLDPENHPLESQTVTPRDPDKITPAWSPWKLYFQVMPSLSYARITTNKIDNEVITETKEPSLVSGDRLGFRIEAGAQYQWRERVQLTSGLLFFSTNQKIEYETSSLSAFEVNTGLENQNFIASPEFDTLTQLYEYDMRNLGIHLGFNYKLGKGRLQHYFGSGIEFHKTLNKYATYGDAGELEAPSMYSFINFRYRLEYPISKSFDFYFQPMVNYTLFVKQGNTSAPFYVKPYGVGLNFGITYQLPGK